jgi:hypothetical protein
VDEVDVVEFIVMEVTCLLLHVRELEGAGI